MHRLGTDLLIIIQFRADPSEIHTNTFAAAFDEQINCCEYLRLTAHQPPGFEWGQVNCSEYLRFEKQTAPPRTKEQAHSNGYLRLRNNHHLTLEGTIAL